jgi:hypothetical protein
MKSNLCGSLLLAYPYFTSLGEEIVVDSRGKGRAYLKGKGIHRIPFREALERQIAIEDGIR